MAQLFISSFIALLMSFTALTAQCLSNNIEQLNQKVSKTTGSADLDKFLNIEKFNIETVFRLHVDMKILDDSDQPNALATAQSKNPFYFDGTVYLGSTLLNDELISRKNGVYAIRGIMAHEFAHILQNKLKCELIGTFRELHADFLAGYYLGISELFADSNQTTVFAQSLFEKGDGALWEEGHHGTPEMRVQAMMGGYNAVVSGLVQTPEQAYNEGVTLFSNGGDDGSLQPVENDDTEGPATGNIALEFEDGTVYTSLFTVFFNAGDVEYEGIIALENGEGVMRLLYHSPACDCDVVVEQTMTVKTWEKGYKVEGSNPINVETGKPMLTYNPDNLYLELNNGGAARVFNEDRTGSVSEVTVNDLTDPKGLENWLVYLKWK